MIILESRECVPQREVSQGTDAGKAEAEEGDEKRWK